MSHTKSEKNKAKEYFYKEGVKNVGKEKTIEGLKRAFAKKMPLSEEAKNFIARNKITPEMRKKTFDRIQKNRIKSGN